MENFWRAPARRFERAVGSEPDACPLMPPARYIRRQPETLSLSGLQVLHIRFGIRTAETQSTTAELPVQPGIHLVCVSVHYQMDADAPSKLQISQVIDQICSRSLLCLLWLILPPTGGKLYLSDRPDRLANAPINSSGRMGLVKCTWKPAANARFLSSVVTYAVRATAGIFPPCSQSCARTCPIN